MRRILPFFRALALASAATTLFLVLAAMLLILALAASDMPISIKESMLWLLPIVMFVVGIYGATVIVTQYIRFGG